MKKKKKTVLEQETGEQSLHRRLRIVLLEEKIELKKEFEHPLRGQTHIRTGSFFLLIQKVQYSLQGNKLKARHLLASS